MDNNQTRSMEAVHNFTNELFSLYDFKVPISKAKMGAITKSALKAIKFYKHVVQNVEKFILKCKPEYKIPGLYVIDAIVRQSRHQFGAEKDVFAPRFARNMEDTFAHLFRCTQEDKSKIIRVLNLWQKNNVFAPEVIQPLFDLANPDHPVHQNYNLQQQQNQANDVSNGSAVRESPIKEDQNTEMLNASNLQKFQYQQLMMQQQTDSGSTSVAFNKQLLEFDYGSDGDDVDRSDAMNYQAASSNALPYQFSKVLEDPNIIKQLQNIKNIDVQRYLNEMPSGNPMEMTAAPLLGGGITLANINTLRGPQTINLIESKDQDVEFIGGDTMMPEVIPVSSRSPTPNKHSSSSSKRRRSRSYSRDRDRYRGGRSLRRSRSHSRSRSRSPRNSRRRSSRDRDRPRDKEREKQREIDKERRRKGLPDIKKEHLSVCSTTLWVGHLSKLVQQEELSDTFGKYGDIISIDMIPPRGCAYIVMNRRQDAHKAMQSLKSHKMHNRAITISWAAGKGVKGKEWKDYFDQTLGVTYIPYSKLTQQTDFEALEEGGMYDEDTMPAWVKEKMKQPAQPVVNKDGLIMPPFFGLPSDVTAIDTSQPPPSAQALMPTAMPTFPLGARLLMPNVLPLGVPPPNMLGMVFPSTSADKNVLNPALMGFPLAAAAAAVANVQQQQQQSVPGDDHMDIEMEDEHHNPTTSKDSHLQQQQAAFYNQPPPQLGMASLMMQQNESQNDRNRNNRSNSRERDRRRRSDNNFNRNSGRWPNNDSNPRDDRRNNGRSREGGSFNNFNRRHHDDQFSQPMDNNNRQRNNDFNSMSRDDYRDDRRGFSGRGGFNQSMRGNRGGSNFTPRGVGRDFGGRGRDGNMRGYNNNFNNDRQGGFHDRDSRGGSRGGRNWNREENDDRRQNFRGGNRNQRWSQRTDDGWNDEEGNQNSNNEFTEENQASFDNNEKNEDFQQENERNDDAPPPGTDDYDQPQESYNEAPQSEAYSSNNNSGGNNEEHTTNSNECAVVENAGNMTPLCDENEAKE